MYLGPKRHQRKLADTCHVCQAPPGTYCWNITAAKKGQSKHTCTLHYWTEGGLGDPALASSSKRPDDIRYVANKRRKQKKEPPKWVDILILMGAEVGKLQRIVDFMESEDLPYAKQIHWSAEALLQGLHDLVEELQ